MFSENIRYYYFSYFLIAFGLLVSGYLLFHHFAIMAGKIPESDLCSVVFGKGCLGAALSNFSVFMKIPVGGWGLIYLMILLCLLILSQIFFPFESDEIIQIAFWISLAGILISLFYILLMMIHPVLFCPFCTVFHVLNFTLFIFILKLTQKPLSSLIKGLKKAIGIVFLAKSLPEGFIKWKWLAFIFPFILGIAVYQWIIMQGQNIRIEKLSGYNPLAEIEKFEANEVFEIRLSDDDAVLGSIDAPVSLIVFSDFQCPLCEMFASNFRHILEYNKDKINIRFKHFPLSSDCNSITKENMHPLACKAARAGEAARIQGRFWEFHDSLYEQGKLKNEEQLFEIARFLKLDMKQFLYDYNSEKCMTKINNDIQEGIRLKLDGTPSAFLNGRKLHQLSENNINFLVKYLTR